MLHQSIKNLIGLACSFLILSLSIFFAFTLSERSIRSVWEGYRILIVPLTVNEQSVIDVLSKSHIEFCTEANSKIENTNLKVPVIPQLETFNTSLKPWFTDEAQNSRFFYLKESTLLDKKIKKITKQTNLIDFFEQSGAYNYLSPFLCILFLIALSILYKKTFFLFFLPFALIGAWLNTFQGYFISFFCILCVWFIENTVGFRSIKFLKKPYLNQILPIFIITFIFLSVILFITGLKACIYFFLAFLQIVSLININKHVEKKVKYMLSKKRLHPRFKYTIINPFFSKISVIKKENGLILLFFFIFLTLGILLFRTNSAFLAKKNISSISVPSPVGYTQKSGFGILPYTSFLEHKNALGLPDLSDFICMHWIIESAFWNRTQGTQNRPSVDTEIEWNSYFEGIDGKIMKIKKTMISFDEDFIYSMISKSTNPLERMLIEQNRFLAVEKKRLTK